MAVQMIELDSLEDVGSAYVSAAQGETNALFAQGEVLLIAIEGGFAVRDVVRHCASLTRRTERTVFTRYAVAQVFPSDKRDGELDWYIHALCAATDKPYDWLEIAAAGYTDEHGNHHGHTSRTLKAAIRAASGNPEQHKPIILLDAEPVTLLTIGVNIVDFQMNETLTDRIRDYAGQAVVLTLALKAPSVDEMTL